MICRLPMGTKISDDISNAFLFYQCINEMGFDFTPDTYKAKTMTSHSLCKEIIITYKELRDSAAERKYYSRYICVMLEELITNLRNDSAAKAVLGKRFNKIVSSLEECKENEHRLENVVRMLYGYLDSDSYRNELVNQLVELICGKKRQNELINLSNIWMSEMISAGYSKQYIYNWSQKFFTRRVIASADDIMVFFNYFTFKVEKWEYIILVDGNVIPYLNSLKRLNEINNIEIEKISFDKIEELINQSNQRALNWFMNQARAVKKIDKVDFVKCACNAFDPYEGMKNIQGYLRFFSNIITTVDNEAKKMYNECVCLNYERTRIAVKSAMERRNRIYSQDYLPNVFKLLKSMNASQSTYHALMTVFSYHGDAIMQGLDNKYAITMLWTALETLFVDEKAKVGKGENVKSALIEIIQRTYIVKLLKNLHRDFLANFKAIDYSIVVKYGLEDLEVFVDSLFDEEDEQRNIDIIKTLENNPLLRTRVHKLVTNSFATGESICKLLLQHKRNIELQIDRIYRNRNFLIHAGREFWYVPDIVECLHNYVDFVTNYFIVKMEAGEHISDVYDVLYEAKCDNEVHFSIINKNKNTRVTKDNYKEMLFGPSDNVLNYYKNHSV